MRLLRYKTQITQVKRRYPRKLLIGNLDYADSLGCFPDEGGTMKRTIRKFWRDTQGQDLVEYALAAGMVAVAAVASMPPLSAILTNVFNAIGGLIQNNVP